MREGVAYERNLKLIGAMAQRLDASKVRGAGVIALRKHLAQPLRRLDRPKTAAP